LKNITLLDVEYQTEFDSGAGKILLLFWCSF